MTLRRLLLLLALLLLPAAPASASPAAVARLVSCDPQARTVAFEGAMRDVPGGAARLQMRFTLEVRDGGWERVAAPTFDEWTSAAPGRTGYVYAKHVEDLVPGAYRVLVRFRWRDAEGAVLRTVRRRSKTCVVPDERPNLAPVRIRQKAGPTDATTRYTVVVANRGRSAAGAFAVGFSVDGVPLADRRVDGLAAGERVRVAFVGPACDHDDDVLVATVDPDGLVEEAEEANDTLTAACEDV
jgi:hypothetical protein